MIPRNLSLIFMIVFLERWRFKRGNTNRRTSIHTSNMVFPFSTHFDYGKTIHAVSSYERRSNTWNHKLKTIRISEHEIISWNVRDASRKCFNNHGKNFMSMYNLDFLTHTNTRVNASGHIRLLKESICPIL